MEVSIVSRTTIATLLITAYVASGKNSNPHSTIAGHEHCILVPGNHLYHPRRPHGPHGMNSGRAFPPSPSPFPDCCLRSTSVSSTYLTSLIGGARDEPIAPPGEEPGSVLNPMAPAGESPSILPTPHSDSGGSGSSHLVPAFLQSKRSHDRCSWKWHVLSAQDHLSRLKEKASATFLSSQTVGATSTGNKNDLHVPLNFIRALGPALAAVFGFHSSEKLVSFTSLYAWALVGSSVGFYLYLYFISIGHALGIFFPVAATLLRYCRRAGSISACSFLHSALVLAWAVRLLVFLVWREYYSWPALHAKILRVNAEVHQKLICWLLYSFLYVCMLAPCWFRLESDIAAVGSVVNGRGTVVLGLVLQLVGLLVESVADWQKSRFKALHRTEWCNTGLWKLSTHPNYAGEWLFWLGTVTASMSSILGSSSAAIVLVKIVVVVIGFLFLTTILSGATQKLEQKQKAKYAYVPAFVTFTARTGVFGRRVRLTTEDYGLVEAQLPVEEYS